MNIEYTKDEMRAVWKRLRWLEPLRADATVVRSDGTDIDRVAETQMRQWYLQLLAEAPMDMLVLTDLSASAMVRRVAAADCYPASVDMIKVTVPKNAIRLGRVKISGAAVCADIVENPSDPRWRLSLNRFRRQMAPMTALWRRDSCTLLLPAPADGSLPKVTLLHAVVDPGPDIYRFREPALATIAPVAGV